MIRAVLYVTLALLVFMPKEATAEVASYYSEELRGSLQANGTPFDPDQLTVAHRTLPFGSKVTVCHKRCATSTVTDRGPYVNGRDLDLSRATADAIGLTPAGVGQVTVTYH